MGIQKRHINFLVSVQLFITVVFTSNAFGQVPSANFTASPTSGCSPLVVNFQDLSSNNPSSWVWNFGNGATSTAQNPTTTFFNPGTYTISLTATNASGSNTLTRTAYITVYESPTVNFSVNQATGCFPLRAQFTDLSTAGSGNSITSWEWSFGDGAVSTQQNPSHNYNITGNYSVTLKVTNDKGCIKTVTKNQFIQVSQGVTASFLNTSPNVCRPPVDISFNNTTTGPGTISYTWYFGDGGTSNLTNPNHIYNTPGNFNVSLVATSSQGCTDSLVKGNAVVIDTIITDFTAPDSICVADSVHFINASIPTPLGSTWDFGDGTNSSLAHPTKSYSTPGAYTIKLINNFNTCLDSVSKIIQVIPPPVTDFVAPDKNKCQPPFTVSFQDLTTGNPVSWFWNFGDGGTSTLQNPSHTYNSYGLFSVTLITTNSTGCSDTTTKSQYIRIVRPVITFNDLPAQGCAPFTVNFSAGITGVDGVTSYLWNFGDGNTSSLPTPSHTYNMLGAYTVSLTITTATGCTETLSLGNAVKAGSSPVADFSISNDTSCLSQAIQFTDLSVPSDDWLWDFGNGATSTLKNPLYQYTNPGTYSVKLVARYSGCPDSILKTDLITILSPQSFFTYTLNCGSRNDFRFTDQSDSASAWFWDFGDGTTSTLQNPAHTFIALGNYNVSLTVTYGACSHTFMRVINVVQENPDITVIPNPVCRNKPLSFTAANVNSANINNYYWDFGDGTNISGGGLINHAFANAGFYSIRLITTDLNGCKDTIDKTNFVRINGAVAGFTGTNISGCNGLTTTFLDSSTLDGINNIVNWQWDFGDGTIQSYPAPPFTHTYPNIGSYTIKLKVTDAAGCTDSITRVSYVNTSDPSVLFSTSTPQSCPGAPVRFNVNTTGNIAAYLWDFGDGNTSTQAFPNPPHAYANTGLYTVQLTITDQNGCKDSLVRTQYISIDKPIADFTMNDSISSCAPFEVNFTNTSTYYYAQKWNFGDGNTSTLQNPSHYFNTPGTYTVQLIIQSAGTCYDTIQKTVTLYDTTGTRITYGPFEGCKPQLVSFSAFANGPLTYLWDFGDGETLMSSSPDIDHVYNSYGIFIPKVILQDQTGCLIPVSGIDTISITGANANFGLDRELICDNGTINFIDSTTSNDPVTLYSWDFGDGATSSQPAPSHFYATTGYYNITLAVQTQIGCTDTLRKDSVLLISKSPVIQINGDSLACVMAPLQFSGSVQLPDTALLSWNWNFDNGNSATGVQPPPQFYSASGNFLITAVATNSNGCKDSATKQIRIHPLPTVSMPPELTVIAGTVTSIPAIYSGTMNSYIWTPANDLSCTDCPRPDASPGVNTWYTVAFVDSNGCVNKDSLLIKVLCKNANIFMPNTFSPNGDGRNDIFYPRGTGVANVKTLRIFNRWGGIVFEKQNFPANDASAGWDGTFNGKAANNDVYVYQLEIYCQNGELIKMDGNVALIR
ncbi:MAG: PKD domain-containing protein [Terrimonas sp.]|nr:PKD domain-containing protein [Terrimonas sp.]